jgi:anion transporter
MTMAMRLTLQSSGLQLDRLMHVIDRNVTMRTLLLVAAWYLSPLLLLGSDIALSPEGRWVLIILVGAVSGWLWSRLNDTLIAAAAGFALILTGALPNSDVYSALGADIIWLMVAAFILAQALRETGIIQSVAQRLLGRTGHISALAHGLTVMIFLTAFLVPSTSARAALFLPVFQSLAACLNLAQTRVIALVIPTSILLTAVASLTGAGAHLAATAFLQARGMPAVGFVDWALMMAPGAILSAHVATAIILRLFITSTDEQIDPLPQAGISASGRSETLVVVGIFALVLVGWVSESSHGIPTSVVAWLGVIALFLVLPGTFSLKKSLKSVEWELILFLALTLALGLAITRTDLDEWCIRLLTATVATDSPSARSIMLPIIVLIGLLAHLVVTSRTARVTVLVPALVLPAQAFGLDPIITTLVLVMATGFCQTLPASAKPVALFAGLEPAPYAPGDLVRLSLWIGPLMAVLIYGLGWIYWPGMLPILSRG